MPNETLIYPVNFVGEPTVQSAESNFHIRSLLLSANYTVSEQTTDLGLEFNYFSKEAPADMIVYQRVQILYMLRQYLSPDTTNALQPSLRVHILCGDGRLFTAFRQELTLANFFMTPFTKFASSNEPGYNALKHAHAFYIEAIANDVMRLHDVLGLVGARGIPDDQKIATDRPVRMSSAELRDWFRAPSGPCTLSYLLEHKDELAMAVVNSASFYQKHIAEKIKTEWHPYLSGLFIYTCRLRLAQPDASHMCGPQAVASAASNNTIDSGCTELKAEACAVGPSGDCL